MSLAGGGVPTAIPSYSACDGRRPRAKQLAGRTLPRNADRKGEGMAGIIVPPQCETIAGTGAMSGSSRDRLPSRQEL